jgi:ABC-2 type transport system permease protein
MSTGRLTTARLTTARLTTARLTMARLTTGTLHAEWTKLRTVPATAWLLLGIVGLTAAAGVLADAAAKCPASGCGLDPARVSLTGTYLGQALVAVLAVVAISGEYSSGMIRTTLAAVPRRGAVLAAKASTVSAVVLLAGAAAVLASWLAGRLILPGRGFTAADGYASLSLTDGPMLRAVAGTAVYLALVGLLSLGIATAVREPAAAIGIVLALLYVVPIIAAVVGSPAARRHLEQFAPMTAGLAIQDTTNLAAAPIGPWAGLGVLAGWTAAGLLAGTLALAWRDA